jgi:hypothetical protein
MFKYNAVAKLWKNGVAQDLVGVRNARCVYVSGNDVYVVGYVENAQGKDVAMFWKNGEKQNLSDGDNNAEALCVFVK